MLSRERLDSVNFGIKQVCIYTTTCTNGTLTLKCINLDDNIATLFEWKLPRDAQQADLRLKCRHRPVQCSRLFLTRGEIELGESSSSRQGPAHAPHPHWS